MKLLLIIIEGQVYLATIVAIFITELAFLGWGLWSRRPIIVLLAVFVAVPLLKSTLGAIRACFTRIRPPDGLSLARADGAALHELVEGIRQAILAPPVDGIVITGGLDASAVVERRPWRFGRRRTLVLGLPVLATLSLPELRAVIAHELAHFSKAHDGFAAWVYRTRLSWVALRATLDRRLATPVYVYWFMRWYVPRLNEASAEVSRRHELVADQVAAKVAGARAAADALVVFESAARFADEVYWPAIQTSHETAADLPQPYLQMLSWRARASASEELDSLFADDTEPGDSHPSLRERFASLGQTVRIPPPTERSAGDELFGAVLGTLAGQLDEGWIERHGGTWRGHRAAYLERRASLDRLAAIETPTPDELFRRAEAIEALHGPDEALPSYQGAAGQGHAAASLAAGRLLLGRMDSTGIALVEASMDRDETLIPEGCRILADYYRAANQELAARKCEWRASRHATREHLMP